MPTDALSLVEPHSLYSGTGQPQDPATTSYITSLDSSSRAREGVAWARVDASRAVDLDTDQRSELRDHLGRRWVNQPDDADMPFRLKDADAVLNVNGSRTVPVADGLNLKYRDFLRCARPPLVAVDVHCGRSSLGDPIYGSQIRIHRRARGSSPAGGGGGGDRRGLALCDLTFGGALSVEVQQGLSPPQNSHSDFRWKSFETPTVASPGLEGMRKDQFMTYEDGVVESANTVIVTINRKYMVIQRHWTRPDDFWLVFIVFLCYFW